MNSLLDVMAFFGALGVLFFIAVLLRYLEGIMPGVGEVLATIFMMACIAALVYRVVV